MKFPRNSHRIHKFPKTLDTSHMRNTHKASFLFFHFHSSFGLVASYFLYQASTLFLLLRATNAHAIPPTVAKPRATPRVFLVLSINTGFKVDIRRTPMGLHILLATRRAFIFRVKVSRPRKYFRKTCLWNHSSLEAR